MKKIVLVLFAAALLINGASFVYAADNPADKLGRGFVNILTAPIEIPKQIDVEWKQHAQEKKNVGIGITAGFIKGLAYTVARLGSGVWDIASFPFKVPENYEPVMKPEFVLEK